MSRRGRRWRPISSGVSSTSPPTRRRSITTGDSGPGNNLFGTSIIALDVETGNRVWHFQTVHHPIWNYDLPNVPILVDVTVDGEAVPMVIQTTKQGMTFAFNRVTGEPVWPIEERAVPASVVPGEQLSTTQPFPTKPAPLEALGLPEENVIDFTPELRAEALEIMSQYRIGGPYMPPLPEGHTESVKGWVACSGGLNITNPAALDPTTGILYQPSAAGCSGRTVQRGAPRDEDTHTCTSSEGDCWTTGTTISDWVAGGAGIGWAGPQGLPMHKPPYNRVTAIDMNTGEHLWWVPIGEASDRMKGHPALQGVDLSGVGGGARAVSMVTGSLLLTTRGSRGPAVLDARNKLTGDLVGSVELPAPGQYGMMTYMHEGHQYILVQVAQGGTFQGALAALRLPDGH